MCLQKVDFIFHVRFFSIHFKCKVFPSKLDQKLLKGDNHILQYSFTFLSKCQVQARHKRVCLLHCLSEFVKSGSAYVRLHQLRCDVIYTYA